jgi:hypothetical protein
MVGALYLCLIIYKAIERYLEMEVQLYIFLTLALDESKWPASRPGRFIHMEKPPVLIEWGAGGY